MVGRRLPNYDVFSLIKYAGLTSAPVAHRIEQGLPKPRVGGSIPPRRVLNDGHLDRLHSIGT